MPGDTHTCSDCGGQRRNPNPLDSCGRGQLGCNNPCGVGPHNTARCESLPSQIENFTLQFFGTVVKTEINGHVTWSLPCSLETGLPGNPRGVDEGLACYFLRLFRDGLGGLKGDKGDPGTPGVNGTNAYTVVTQGFVQPTAQNPLVQFVVAANPAILPGMNVFVSGSGYYLVTAVLSGGIIFATFQVAAPSPVGYVQAGSLVIPTGANAAGAPGTPGSKGDKGDPGIQGIPGAPGPVVTQENGQTILATGSPFSLPTGAYAPVTIGSAPLSFSAPESGTYLITAVVDVTTTVQQATGGNSPESVYVKAKLRNATTAIDFAGTERATVFVFTNSVMATQGSQIVINYIATVGLGDAVEVSMRTTDSGAGSTGGLAWATANTGSISWVRIA
jgi:hypothetical protein